MIKRDRTEFGWVRQETKPFKEGQHQIAPLTETDEKQRELMMRAALDMGRRVKLINEETAYLTPQQLDVCWEKVAPTPENFVEELFGAYLFGIPLGEYFVIRHSMFWCRFIDENGSSLAVHHPEAQVTAFPVASVKKRLVPRDPPFFRAVESTIVKQIASSLKMKQEIEAERAAAGDKKADG